MLDSTRTPFITTQYGQYAVAARALGTVREGGEEFPGGTGVHDGSTRTRHGERGAGRLPSGTGSTRWQHAHWAR